MTATVVAVHTKAAQPPATPNKRKPRQRKVSHRVAMALELLATGACSTQKEAAAIAGISAEHLCKQLQKEHVHDHLTRAAKRHLAGHILRAAHVKTGLLAAESEKVKSDVASEIMAIGGIMPPAGKGHGVSVQVGVQVGYVVDWNPQAPVDVTPANTR